MALHNWFNVRRRSPLLEPDSFWSPLVIGATVVGIVFGVAIVIGFAVYVRQASEDPKMQKVDVAPGSAVRV